MAIKSKDVKATAAGMHEDFTRLWLDMKNIFKEDKLVLEATGSVSVSNLSTDLVQGMTIKAYDGGKEIETER